jgi:hypothetical protein
MWEGDGVVISEKKIMVGEREQVLFIKLIK